MNTWTRLFKVRDGHTFFRNNDDLIAIADDSMRNRNDPATADDGLLILDRTRQVQFHANNCVSIPVQTDRGGNKYWISGAWCEGMAAVCSFGAPFTLSTELGELLGFLRAREAA